MVLETRDAFTHSLLLFPVKILCVKSLVRYSIADSSQQTTMHKEYFCDFRETTG